MQAHLLVSKTNLGAAWILYARRMTALVVQCCDLVNADNNLVNLAAILVFSCSHDGRINFSERRFAGYVVPRKISLVECVVKSGASSYRANWENGRRHPVARLCEIRLGHISQVLVWLPSFCNFCRNPCVSAHYISAHSLLFLLFIILLACSLLLRSVQQCAGLLWLLLPVQCQR